MRIFPVVNIDLALGHSMAAREASKPRGVGLHMSDIYGKLFQELEPKRYGAGPIDDEGWRRIELGLALEEMIEEGLARRQFERPDERQTPEGIWYNPDGVLFDDTSRIDRALRALVLCELKATWMSPKDCPITTEQAIAAGLDPENPAVNWSGDPDVATFPPKFDKYLCQMMAYSWNLDTTDARLYVFFVNGLTRSPAMLAWDIEFTVQELEDNWRMLLNFARERGMLPMLIEEGIVERGTV